MGGGEGLPAAAIPPPPFACFREARENTQKPGKKNLQINKPTGKQCWKKLFKKSVEKLPVYGWFARENTQKPGKKSYLQFLYLFIPFNFIPFFKLFIKIVSWSDSLSFETKFVEISQLDFEI